MVTNTKRGNLPMSGDYKKDDYKKDDYKKDDYKKEDHKKDDYWKDDYRKDDYWKDDRKKEQEKKEDFKKLVKAAIQDELGAVAMYAQMAAMVTNPTLKAILVGIAGDEYGHARTFMTILTLDD
jgi:rubrerythrin